MEKAEILKQYGDNVFVKIPIVTTKGESTLPLIKKLSADNVRLNVTAVYTIEQVKAITDAVTEGSQLMYLYLPVELQIQG